MRDRPVAVDGERRAVEVRPVARVGPGVDRRGCSGRRGDEREQEPAAMAAEATAVRTDRSERGERIWDMALDPPGHGRRRRRDRVQDARDAARGSICGSSAGKTGRKVAVGVVARPRRPRVTLREPRHGVRSTGVGSLGLLPGSQPQPRRRRRDGRWAPRHRAPARPRPRAYPPSIFFARSLSALRAFLCSSLPAPGGRTEGRGGTSAAEAPTTENQGTLAGWRGFLYVRRSRGRPGGGTAATMTMTKGEHRRVATARPQRGTGQARNGAATCPATAPPTPAAVEQARKAMLHEVRSRKRTRIGADA